MPVIGEDGKPVSPFAGIASLSEAQRKDYYYAMLLEMDVLENTLRGVRFDRKYGSDSLPSEYRFVAFNKTDETRNFLRTLINPEQADAGAGDAKYTQMRKDAYRYYVCLRNAMTELDFQERQVRELITLRDNMNAVAGVKGKEEEYETARALFEKKESIYKSKFLPNQEKAKRLEHIHLPELEVELANVLAARKSCGILVDQMPGALIDQGLSDTNVNVPLADVKDRISRNMKRIEDMGLSGAAQARTQDIGPRMEALQLSLNVKLGKLQQQAAANKQAPGKWYTQVKGPAASGNVKATLDRLYNGDDAKREGNTEWYKSMVTMGKNLRNLLEGKDDKGNRLKTDVTVGMLKSQARLAKAAAQKYLDEKGKQIRPFPSAMRTRRLNEARELLRKARELEESFTKDKLGGMIERDLKSSCDREKLSTARSKDEIQWSYDTKMVPVVQAKIRDEVVSEMGMDDRNLSSIDEVINISEERNRNDIMLNLSRSGKEGKSIDQITGELEMNRRTVTNRQLKDGAKKAGVSETSYQEIMKRELDINRIERPSDLDELRRKKTDQYVAEFKQMLSRCGISTGRYSEMTENVSSRKEADVRKGLRQLSEMAAKAEEKGIKRETFIHSAVKSSEFFWEQDLNDVCDINRIAGAIKLSSADLVSEKAIDAAMNRWKAAQKEQKQVQKQI